MRASAIVRIVIWSIVALALTGVLVAALTTGFSFGGISLGSSFSYSDSDRYLVGGNSIDMREISEIEVNWVAGEVEITAYEGSDVVFREEARPGLSQEDRMRFRVQDGKLTIQFCAPRMGFRIFSSTPSKRLELKVPEAMAGLLSELEVNSVSAPVRVQGVSGVKTSIENVSGSIHAADLDSEKLKLETVSGAISGQNIRAGELHIDTVSGSSELSGAFGDVDGDSVSGSVTLRSSICPDKIRMDTVSGAVYVAIPENDGFTAKYSTTSGQFSCSFATIGEKKRVVYQNGRADFSFNTVSGGISIEKA